MQNPNYFEEKSRYSFEEIVKNTEESLSKLSSIGLRVSGPNRFSSFVKRMRSFGSVLKSSDLSSKDFDIASLSEGVRDSSELRAIVSSEKAMSECKKELQLMLGGSTFPSEDRLTRARDLQFQLYLSSVMDISGFRIVNEEPDFSFYFKDRKYSVAAKRISSVDMICKRLSKAKDQIKKHNNCGLIAISLDRLIWDQVGKDALLVAGHPDTLFPAGQKIMGSILKSEKVGKQVLKSNDQQIVGYIFSLTVPAIIPRYSSFGISSTLQFVPSFSVEGSSIYDDIKEMPRHLKH